MEWKGEERRERERGLEREEETKGEWRGGEGRRKKRGERGLGREGEGKGRKEGRKCEREG